MDLTLEAVRVGLDLNQLRMEVASTNIARTDMPGAQLERADFSGAVAALHDAAQSQDGDPERLEAITPQTLRMNIESLGPAGADTVVLDDQIAQLNTDSVTYRALATGLTRRFALMQLAIAGK